MRIPFVALLILAAATAREHPNVVVFLSDDQGWGDLGVNGNTDLETPHIDSLARDGARFDRFYVCPVCSPTRAEFLTGRYHTRLGVHSTSAGGERLNLDEKTIADSFRAAGYATGAFGKWHNGMQHPYHPNGRGFDEFYGFCSGHWGTYFDPPLEHNGALVRGKGFLVDDLTDHAMRFMERNRDKPFFVYLPYNTPHSPMQVPDRWWNKYKDKDLKLRNIQPGREIDRHKRCALAMCENIDWNVGRVLAKLDELSLAKDTMVLYFCDNGPNGWRWNGGMRGRKGSTDEGGVRSPLLVRWPGRIAPGTEIEPIAAAIDLHPTLCALAGVKPAGVKPFDGLDISALLLGTGEPPPDRVLHHSWRNRLSLRNQRFRLDDKGRLHDIAADPGQTRDVAAEHPAVHARLRAAADAWRKEMAGAARKDERPFVLGHPDATHTQMPARDAVANGRIQRSNRFPNCSYFHGWTRVEDTIAWDTEVPAPGAFSVELHYTCAPADLGSVVELSFGGARLRATIDRAAESPELGAEHDRHERAESYVKNWGVLDLGTIDLPAGEGPLTLRAVEKPGREVMEFRLLQFTRIGGE